MRRLCFKGSDLARYLLFLLLTVAVSAPVFSAGSDNAEPGIDLRVLIDVSGSMKRTDPKNLRRPALRLLVGLLPDNSQSGIWVFGKLVNMAVPLGKVNNKWRDKARDEANKIHSLGLYTNIEDALEKSTFGWKKPAKGIKRTVILLSDGMVDVSKDAAVNNKSRDRILNEILPRLQRSGVTVHTIALSANADEELLETLAVSTEGWFEKVDNADTLQRVFLRLFEKSTPVDTVPVEDNIFEVDGTIDDMTLLVFRESGDDETSILSPGGKSFDNKNHPDNVNWFHEVGFDLVTVNNPTPGSWKMNSRIDPDNRVIVVTNLKLKVGKVANHILHGEEMSLTARLEQNAKVINEEKLLKHVDFLYGLGKKQYRLSEQLMMDDGSLPNDAPQDGIYSGNVKKFDKGKQQLSILAIGPTFKREYFNIVNVHDSPVNGEVYQQENNFDGFTISLKAKRIKGLKVEFLEVNSKDNALEIELEEVSAGKWRIPLAAKYSQSKLDIVYRAQINNRNPIDFILPLEVPKFIEAATSEEVIADSAAEKEVHQEPVAEEPPVEEVASEKDEQVNEENSSEKDEEGSKEVSTEATAKDKAKLKKKKKGIHWIIVLALVMVVNAFLGLAGVGGYLFWKKRKEKTKVVDDAEVTYE